MNATQVLKTVGNAYRWTETDMDFVWLRTSIIENQWRRDHKSSSEGIEEVLWLLVKHGYLHTRLFTVLETDEWVWEVDRWGNRYLKEKEYTVRKWRLTEKGIAQLKHWEKLGKF